MTCDAWYEVVPKSQIISVLRGWKSCCFWAQKSPDPLISGLVNFILLHFIFFAHIYFPASGQAMVPGVILSDLSPGSCLQFLSRVGFSNPTARRFFIECLLLTHALALSASQFVRKKKSPRIYTSMHSGGFELTKPTYTMLEDNLIRHRGDRLFYEPRTMISGPIVDVFFFWRRRILLKRETIATNSSRNSLYSW